MDRPRTKQAERRCRDWQAASGPWLRCLVLHEARLEEACVAGDVRDRFHRTPPKVAHAQTSKHTKESTTSDDGRRRTRTSIVLDNLLQALDHGDRERLPLAADKARTKHR